VFDFWNRSVIRIYEFRNLESRIGNGKLVKF